MTFTPKTPAFEKAIKESRNLKAKPDNDELLEVENPLTPLLTSLAYTNNRRAPQLYSLFKQGSQDPSFAEAPKPGMFDLTVRHLLRRSLFPQLASKPAWEATQEAEGVIRAKRNTTPGNKSRKMVCRRRMRRRNTLRK